MNDLGFISNTEPLSARSEPSPRAELPRFPRLVKGSGCTACDNPDVVLRWCLTHKRHEWFEKDKHFRGTHDMLDKPRWAEVDGEGRGSWMKHRCKRVRSVG